MEENRDVWEKSERVGGKTGGTGYVDIGNRRRDMKRNEERRKEGVL